MTSNGNTPTKDALLAELASEMDRVEREFLDRVAEIPGAAVYHVQDEYIVTCPPDKVSDVGRLLERTMREGQAHPHILTAYPEDPYAKVAYDWSKAPKAKPVERRPMMLPELGAPYTYHGARSGRFDPSPLAAGFIRDIQDSGGEREHVLKPVPTPPKRAEPWIHPVIAITESTRVLHRNHHGGQGLVKVWRGGRQVTLYQCATPVHKWDNGPRQWLRNEIAERVPVKYQVDELWDTSEQPAARVGGLRAVESYFQ